jgi:hypothetical protein
MPTLIMVIPQPKAISCFIWVSSISIIILYILHPKYRLRNVASSPSSLVLYIDITQLLAVVLHLQQVSTLHD